MPSRHGSSNFQNQYFRLSYKSQADFVQKLFSQNVVWQAVYISSQAEQTNPVETVQAANWS